MAQIITVDFAARRAATRGTQDTIMPGERDRAKAEQPARDRRRVETITAPTPIVPMPASQVMGSSAAQPACEPVKSQQPDSLVDACAEMRVRAAALAAAVEDLRQASAELERLPRLARELCEAAV